MQPFRKIRQKRDIVRLLFHKRIRKIEKHDLKSRAVKIELISCYLLIYIFVGLFDVGNEI